MFLKIVEKFSRNTLKSYLFHRLSFYSVFCLASTYAFSGKMLSNLNLILHLKNSGVIKSSIVEQAMLSVDRGFFAPSNPYEDSPQSLGYGATISAPHMHGIALEHLLPNIMVSVGYCLICVIKIIVESSHSNQ